MSNARCLSGFMLAIPRTLAGAELARTIGHHAALNMQPGACGAGQQADSARRVGHQLNADAGASGITRKPSSHCAAAARFRSLAGGPPHGYPDCELGMQAGLAGRRQCSPATRMCGTTPTSAPQPAPNLLVPENAADQAHVRAHVLHGSTRESIWNRGACGSRSPWQRDAIYPQSRHSVKASGKRGVLVEDGWVGSMLRASTTASAGVTAGESRCRGQRRCRWPTVLAQWSAASPIRRRGS